MESAKETQDTKLTGNLRTKSVQFKAETPPMLAPEQPRSHHPSVHRHHERKAQAGLLNPKLVQHTSNVSLIFILKPGGKWVRKKPKDLNSILRTLVVKRKNRLPQAFF